MEPKKIAEAYNTISHLWERDGFDSSNGIEQHTRAIAFAKKRGYALDVGCGCSDRIIDLLSRNGFRPEGLDLSSEMLNIIRHKQPSVTFHQLDIVECELTEHYDFISAWDSLWHVPLARQEQVLEKLINALNVGGVCIFSCGALDEPGEHTNTDMGPEVYYATLGIQGYLHAIERSGSVCRHFELDQYPELHAYFVVQKLA